MFSSLTKNDEALWHGYKYPFGSSHRVYLLKKYVWSEAVFFIVIHVTAYLMILNRQEMEISGNLVTLICLYKRKGSIMAFIVKIKRTHTL